MGFSYTPSSKLLSSPSADRTVRWVVWGTWLVMVLIAAIYVFVLGRNIPLSEDWNLVAPLTGNEPDFWGWLWSQNNEHRVPLPRLVFLGLLQLTNGDFRAGMVFNVVVLALLSAVLMRVAQYLRGGRIRYVDAVFPIALLHLGNGSNMLWAWQLSFVLPIALICGIFLVMVVQPEVTKPSLALFTGLSLISLPLCGAIGLVFVPLLSLWLIYCGIKHWKLAPSGVQNRGVGVFLILSAGVTIAISALYFVGYERPSWNPPSPGLFATLKTAAKFMALGLGPAVEKFWSLSVLASFGFFLPTGVVSIKAVLSNQGWERYRAICIFLFFANTILLALAIGWGRAGLVPSMGLPQRYVVFAVVSFLVAFYIWQLYGKTYQLLAQRMLLIALLLLLPINTIRGHRGWGAWYNQGMVAVEQDLAAGTPLSTIAKRHGEFLIHWWQPEQLETHLQMLQEADIVPLIRSKDS